MINTIDFDAEQFAADNSSSESIVHPGYTPLHTVSGDERRQAGLHFADGIAEDFVARPRNAS